MKSLVENEDHNLIIGFCGSVFHGVSQKYDPILILSDTYASKKSAKFKVEFIS